MPKIIMTKGLPASGKSTWAKETVQNEHMWKRINKDDLRAMIDGGKWSKDNEVQIIRARNTLLDMFMKQGFNVIIDDTNFDPSHEVYLREVAETYQGYTFEIKEFNTDVGTCVYRDKQRENPVGEKVIMGMYKKYVAKPFVPRVQDVNLPHCIVVDIDGTVAENPNRSPYDATKLHEDTSIDVICDLVICYVANRGNFSKDCELVFLTGRDEITRKVTSDWLDQNITGEYRLYMRPEGDHRPDFVVKKEILERDILPKYHVDFLLEDRMRNVKMMREELGLRVLHVAEGNF